MFFGKQDNEAPREILNWRLWYGVFVFGLMGAARGLDEGLIGTSASQKSFIALFGLKDPSKSETEQADLLSNITSMVQLGSIGGALFAFFITDKIGRLWATRQLCLVWILGVVIFLAAATNGSIGMVYAGRFIMGLGIGQTTVVAPSYLAEIAPKFTRGFCVCMFSGSVYLGIMLGTFVGYTYRIMRHAESVSHGYFASWGSSIHISNTSQLQWVVPNLLHVYFAFIIATTSFFAIESPRWLMKVGKNEKAAQNLSKLRNLPVEHWYVQSELLDITDQLEREREATMGAHWTGVLRELVMTPANRYRIMLSIMSQLLGQWSGANSITIYAPEYFAMVGQSGQNEKLFATAIFGVVKFVSAVICALFLIDFVGRKRSLLTGITLQFVAMLYMAIFLLIDTGIGDDEPQTKSEKSAATGAIVMIYLSGFGWAMGWNSIQYLINSEIYPLRLRAIGGSIAMTFHFVNQYGNSKAVPEMFIGMTTGGTMMFFSCVTLIGGVWAWFFLPELAGKSLESVDAVFELPWYLIGRKGKDLTVGMGGAIEEGNVKEKVEAIENVREVEQRA